MLTLINRKKEIILECFTSNAMAYQLTPIVKSTHNFPKWFKDIPDTKLDKNENGNFMQYPTLKRCVGFLELYKKSVSLECWGDIKYEVTPNNGYKYYFSNGTAQEHHNYQRGEGFKNYYHTKLISPWFFREKTGIHFMISPHVWNLEDYYITIPSGILNFDLQHSTNVNIFLPKPKQSIYEFSFTIGDPLIHFTPLSESKIKIKNYLVTDSELMLLAKDIKNSFVGGFKLLQRMKKRTDERMKKEKKCPFNFGD